MTRSLGAALLFFVAVVAAAGQTGTPAAPDSTLSVLSGSDSSHRVLRPSVLKVKQDKPRVPEGDDVPPVLPLADMVSAPPTFPDPSIPSLGYDDSATAVPQQVYRAVGRGVTAPHPIHHPEPEYTDRALKERQQGTVVLKLVVGSDGLPRDVRVYRSLSADLDESAINAVKKWKFAPAMKDGKPVAVLILVEVSFHL
ncbi:MAG TPA: energy transducer TonB [Terriglobales bacterium]|nr:energy transducer TonB [Terriglobales bacterium]